MWTIILAILDVIMTSMGAFFALFLDTKSPGPAKWQYQLNTPGKIAACAIILGMLVGGINQYTSNMQSNREAQSAREKLLEIGEQMSRMREVQEREVDLLVTFQSSIKQFEEIPIPQLVNFDRTPYQEIISENPNLGNYLRQIEVELFGVQVVLTAQRILDHIGCLQFNGVNAIARYLRLPDRMLDDYSIQANNPNKLVSKEEMDAMLSAGIQPILIFQHRNQKPTDFGTVNGKRDSKAATQLAIELGYPSGSIIFFAVDEDFRDPRELDRVMAYFDGVRRNMASEFRVGAYGSGRVLDALRDRRMIQASWLASSTKWEGYTRFRSSYRWSLLEGPVEELCGIEATVSRSQKNSVGWIPL